MEKNVLYQSRYFNKFIQILTTKLLYEQQLEKTKLGTPSFFKMKKGEKMKDNGAVRRRFGRQRNLRKYNRYDRVLF